MARLHEDVDEVIIATNKTLKSDTTATYISKLVKPLGIKRSAVLQAACLSNGDLEIYWMK